MQLFKKFENLRFLEINLRTKSNSLFCQQTCKIKIKSLFLCILRADTHQRTMFVS